MQNDEEIHECQICHTIEKIPEINGGDDTNPDGGDQNDTGTDTTNQQTDQGSGGQTDSGTDSENPGDNSDDDEGRLG